MQVVAVSAVVVSFGLLVIACGAQPGEVERERTSSPESASTTRIGADSGVDDAGALEARFARDVVPVFVRHCTQCHASSARGDYRTAEAAWPALNGPVRQLPTGCRRPGRTEIVVPGKPGSSVLWQVIAEPVAAKSCGMPKSDSRGVLVEIDPDGAATIKRWIEQGARND